MLYPYRINSSSCQERTPRCSIRRLASGYGFCQGGATSCATCPRAKLDRNSPALIEERDTVRTAEGLLCQVERFDVKRGFRTGYIWLRSRKGLILRTIAAVTLYSKSTTRKAVVQV